MMVALQAGRDFVAEHAIRESVSKFPAAVAEKAAITAFYLFALP